MEKEANIDILVRMFRKTLLVTVLFTTITMGISFIGNYQTFMPQTQYQLLRVVQFLSGFSFFATMLIFIIDMFQKTAEKLQKIFLTVFLAVYMLTLLLISTFFLSFHGIRL